MADFYGCLESTSFRVRDRALFLADPDVGLIANHARAEGFFEESGETFSFGWYGQYPSSILIYFDADTDEEKELSVCEVIGRHILPGDVCQIGVSGNEKLRYIGGELQWVTSKGVLSFNAVTEWSDEISERGLLELVEGFGKQARALLPFDQQEKRP